MKKWLIYTLKYYDQNIASVMLVVNIFCARVLKLSFAKKDYLQCKSSCWSSADLYALC